MRLENSTENEEQGTHPNRGDKERRLTPPSVYEKEDEHCGRNNLDDAVNA